MPDVISRKIKYKNHKNIMHIRYFLIMTNLSIKSQIDKVALLSQTRDYHLPILETINFLIQRIVNH